MTVKGARALPRCSDRWTAWNAPRSEAGSTVSRRFLRVGSQGDLCNREEGLQIVGNDRGSLFTAGLFVTVQERGILEGCQ